MNKLTPENQAIVAIFASLLVFSFGYWRVYMAIRLSRKWPIKIFDLIDGAILMLLALCMFHAGLDLRFFGNIIVGHLL